MNLLSDEISTSENNKREVLNILAYSDIFHYPLTKQEIYERSTIEYSKLDKIVSNLVLERKVFQFEEFYTLHNDNKIIELRKTRNNRAKKYLNTAKIITKIISHFPYVRAVFLSGSISKNCIDKNSDIDYFIVTEPGRLWLTTLFFTIFRRTALLNRSKFFCFNYLIDSEHLKIDDQNIYTAIELKTLIPLFGHEYYKRMLKENEWANSFFPKYPLHKDIDSLKAQSTIQKYFENLFNNSFGEFLDIWFLEKSIKRRRKKLSSKYFDYPNYYTNLQRHVAKSHKDEHHPYILKEYSKRVEDLRIKFFL